MTTAWLAFLNGAVAMASVIAGVLFLTYWRDSRDRLFVYFAASFFTLALNWILVAAIAPVEEQRYWLYTLRLLAFGLIAVGIADKTRRSDT